MRHARLAFAILLSTLAGPALAFDTPKALLEAIYQPYQGQAERGDIGRFLSARLEDIRQNQTSTVAASADHSDDLANFDPFVQGDAFFPFDLLIAEPAVLGDRAIATVSFRNFGAPSLMSIAMVRESDGWKVDDIASMGEGENWLYSWLLTVDPFGN
ncbi:hypothetical protein SAMN02983003_1310 [Devosia enhydra]|uniref:DUF3828 domain-containing protein n=1 Tax=Devosia enhydra TaxID=665118 RepID=A0A1K2HX82_9HYPH|nr:hypothetical protein [Devosia enhydra]SFZ82846.1 hypothetical protein SAMN02983003_1310 [Devosia enhydra]